MKRERGRDTSTFVEQGENNREKETMTNMPCLDSSISRLAIDIRSVQKPLIREEQAMKLQFCGYDGIYKAQSESNPNLLKVSR